MRSCTFVLVGYAFDETGASEGGEVKIIRNIDEIFPDEECREGEGETYSLVAFKA